MRTTLARKEQDNVDSLVTGTTENACLSKGSALLMISRSSEAKTFSFKIKFQTILSLNGNIWNLTKRRLSGFQPNTVKTQLFRWLFLKEDHVWILKLKTLKHLRFQHESRFFGSALRLSLKTRNTYLSVTMKTRDTITLTLKLNCLRKNFYWKTE